MSEATTVIGDWKGTIELEELRLPAVLSIVDGDGGLTLSVRQAGGTHATLPPTPALLEGTTITAALDGGDARLEAHVDGDVLTGHLMTGTRTLPIRLIRDDPAFARYELPRATPDAGREQDYTYVPPADGDGWAATHAADVGADAAGLRAYVEDVLADPVRHTDGIVVAIDGKLVLDEYFWGIDAAAPHPMASITKSVTSLLCGIARDRGTFPDLETRVHDLLPDYTGTHWVDDRVAITLRQVLTMTAGLDWVESGVGYLDQRNDASLMESDQDMVAYTLNKRVVRTPGEVFAYTSGLAVVLGEVLARAVGTDVVSFARQHLFGPLGIDRFTWVTDAAGHTHTGGGLALRPRDLAKLGQVVADGGTWAGQRLISEDWVHESTALHSRNDEASYGYQWWLSPSPDDAAQVALVAGLGWGGQRLYVRPGDRTVVVHTGANHDGDDARLDARLLAHLFPAIGWTFASREVG
ncbi:MAG TPA: serine hydrolase [Nitriliruptorales bacterium]